MKRLSRFSAILFAIMLAFASISRGYEVPLLKTVVQDQEGGCSTSYFSEKKLHDVYGSHRQSEHLVSSVNSLPAPGSKIHFINFLGSLFSIEQKLQEVVSNGLAQARRIAPSLSVAVIIFPFHYFW